MILVFLFALIFIMPFIPVAINLVLSKITEFTERTSTYNIGRNIALCIAIMCIVILPFVAPESRLPEEQSYSQPEETALRTSSPTVKKDPLYYTCPDFSDLAPLPPLPTGSPIREIPFEITSYPKNASRNEEVFVTIQGEPYTEYDILVEYSSGPSTAAGLHSKTSDENGYVCWFWKVGGRTSYGRYPITVTDGTWEETVYFRVA